MNGHEFEKTQGDSKRQGNLACCSPWGRKESDTTEQQHLGENILLILSTMEGRKIIFKHEKMSLKNMPELHILKS